VEWWWCLYSRVLARVRLEGARSSICLSYQYIKYNIQFKTKLPLSIKQLFNQANELTSQLAGKLTNVNRS